jgi:hypothetical protein
MRQILARRKIEKSFLSATEATRLEFSFPRLENS